MRYRALLSLIAAGATTAAVAACAPADSAEDAVDRVASAVGTDGGASPGLVEVTGFGANPGALKMYEYAPASLEANPAVVVVLHGCTQGAADIARTGWSDVADARGFLVVYPEQVTANNQARCFNWGGVYGDLSTIQRGKDENQSIKEMVDTAIAAHGADPKRVFVAGFSAGGGQAAVMAATWPDVFSAGATIAGVPYHCNTTFAEAFSCQKPGIDKTPAEWAARVKAAYPSYAGPLPRMSIWQGASDATVGPANRRELVEQWTEVHGVGQTPSATGDVEGAKHSVFKDASGKVVVESYEVPGLDHGVAVDPAAGCGTVAPSAYAVDKKLCTAGLVADFFGLVPGAGGPDAGGGASSSSSSSSSGASGDSSDPAAGGAAPSGGGGGAPAGGGEPDSAGSTCAFRPLASAPRGAGTSAWAIGSLALVLALVIGRRRGHRVQP